MNPEILPPSTDVSGLKHADAGLIFQRYEQESQGLLAKADSITVTDARDALGMSLARTTRLALRNIRLSLEKRRKELVDETTTYVRDVNEKARKVRLLLEEKESRLQNLEDTAERAEAHRVAALIAERSTALQSFGAMIPLDVATISDETFTEILDAAEMRHNLRQAQLRKQEAERIKQEAEQAAERAAREKGEAEERERLRQENAKLQAEALAAKKQREKLEAERAAEARKAQAKIDFERQQAQAQLDQQRAEEKKVRDALEAQGRADRQRREAAERELQEAKDKEAEAARIAKEALEKAASAPDVEKLRAYAQSLLNVCGPGIDDNSPLYPIAEEASEKLIALCRWITEQTK